MTDDSPALDSPPPPPTVPTADDADAAPGWGPSAFWTWAAILAVAALAIALGWTRIEVALDARRLFR